MTIEPASASVTSDLRPLTQITPHVHVESSESVPDNVIPEPTRPAKKKLPWKISPRDDVESSESEIV